ncbi:hypothetical protein BC332_33160 [Capsicum chinense]|nr:hypothetical protein BC332_33160 [Capsicum chinense]
MGLSLSLVPPSRGLGPGPSLRTLLQTTIRTMEPPHSKAGLFLRIIPPDLGSHSECLSSKVSWSPNARRAIAATTKRVEIQPPLSVMSINVDSHLGQPRARGSREARIRPKTTINPVIEAQCEGEMQCVMPRQTCPWPNSFGHNLRSNTPWFMRLYNSH